MKKSLLILVALSLSRPVAASANGPTIGPRLELIDYCHKKGLRSNPHISGKIVVNLQVDASGKVHEARMVSSTVKDTETTACSIRMAAMWKYPPGESAWETTHTLVFVAP